jgi:CIC family chloride channel protein
MASFSPIVISSVLATVVARHYLGGGPVFTVPEYELASIWEFGPYLLLGALCGLVSVLFIRTLYAAEDAFDRLERWPVWAKPVLGGLIVGALGLALPQVLGDGEHVINLALTNQLTWWVMALILFAKILATSCTLGSGGSGGVFAPSLFMGATAGGALGHGVGMLMGASAGEAGGYALVGMGGLVAGTTHAPITAILMIFEITNNYHIILPLMLVCIISITLSSRLHRESIYTLRLVRKGIDLFRGRSLDVLKPYRVGDALHRDVMTFRSDTSLREIQQTVDTVDHTYFYITDEGRLMGVIHLSELSRVMARQAGLEQVLLALDLAHEDSCVCKVSDPISVALVRFEQSGLTELPVVDDTDERKLLGVVRYVEVIGLYNREIIKQDTADTLAGHMHSAGRMEKVKIVEGVSMMEWDPPSSWCGMTLAEAHLPTRYGVRVMLVKKRVEGDAESTIAPISPGGEYRIEPGDTLLVYGPDPDLERLERL